MNASTWQAAETWYESHVLLWLILIVISIFGLLFVLFYRERKHAKKWRLFFCLSLIISGFWTTFQSIKYQSYLDLVTKVSMQIRDRKMGPLGYQYYQKNDKEFYTRLYLPDKIRALPFYQEATVRYPITYLGKNHDSHYFSYQEQIFRERKFVTFSLDVTETELLGSQFILADEDYQSIGFFSPKSIYYKEILVNQSEQGKEYEVPYGELKAGHKIFNDWIFASN
ncbi:hypothetical protein [Isobaculum melis]|uniref:Uncharacterized protein n=1 Tax=Isobaculum melis TaxID=142588 RepID=A0A1H9SQ68_9LACT|nr:hypothetical protein [Isobaculum melis]SER87162.1 hypothetical protein SAMN04488559_108100 [Isobaculum melis]